MSDSLWAAYNAGQTKPPVANETDEEPDDEESLANMTMRTPTESTATTTAMSYSGRSPTDTMKDISGKSIQSNFQI